MTTVRFQVKTEGIKDALDIDGSDLMSISEATLRGMDPFVPFDQGNLAGGASAGQGVVHYPADYASYVYYGTSRIHSVHQDRHPRASMHWAEAYVSDGAQQTVEAVGRCLDAKE